MYAMHSLVQNHRESTPLATVNTILNITEKVTHTDINTCICGALRQWRGYKPEPVQVSDEVNPQPCKLWAIEWRKSHTVPHRNWCVKSHIGYQNKADYLHFHCTEKTISTVQGSSIHTNVNWALEQSFLPNFYDTFTWPHWEGELTINGAKTSHLKTCTSE